MTREFVQGSIDNLDLPVTNTLGTVITDDIPVAISVDKGENWTTAEWLGDEAATRTASILLDTTTLEIGGYAAWVRITATPAVPIVDAGNFSVVD